MLFGSFVIEAAKYDDEHVCNYKRARIFQIFDFDCNTTMLLSHRDAFCATPAVSLDRPDPSRDRLRKHEQFFFSAKGTQRGEHTDTPRKRIETERGGRRYRVTPFNGYRFASAKSCALESARLIVVRPGYISESL